MGSRAKMGENRTPPTKRACIARASSPTGRSGASMARFEVPEGMTVQAFQFTLDLTPAQAACVRRNFGGRRYAYNWAVRTMKAGITAYHADGAESPAPRPRR